MTFDDERAVLSAVIHDAGIALLPSYAVGPAIELRQAEIVLPGVGRTILLNVVYPLARNIPKKVSFVASRFGGARMSHPAVIEEAA